MDDSVVRRSLDKLHVKVEFDSPDQEDDQTDPFNQQQSYVTVLKEEDIWRSMEKKIQIVTDVSSLSKAEATLLLSHFNCVRESVGILERSLDQSPNDEEFFCGGCNETRPFEESASVSCGHHLCSNCWTRDINNIFNKSSEWNVWLKCPYVPCQASVGRDMIESFASEEEKTKYDRYLLKSFVEDSKAMKLCPRAASGRTCAIDLSPDDSGNFTVYCVCLLKFCWNCSKDVHSPVDCKTAAKWLAMTMSGYQNPNRPLANSVPCPKCKQRIIEKEYVIEEFFSLKMTCLPCNYDFCWLCRGDWTEHWEATCNNDAVPSEEIEQQLEMEEFSVHRYNDCYKNWDSNDLIPELSKTQLPTEQQLDFIIEAGLQIIESRRILKWTYAYQYYLPEDKQNLLKTWQDNVKLLLKELDDSIETKLPQYLNAEGSSENFNAFRIKLTALTSTTRKYNETLIRDLEDGLANF
ncbi:unnamed protein product [Arabis nemorensis]|uniref:RBR-type E3 ubiquitin transferase n=1 Tax=Arabis nemorensis TaxID=586526 RepID=A0A565AM81_9BRAS|nr:unnamed protein product [Arabis nemorensis]